MPDFIRVVNPGFWPEEEIINNGYNIDNVNADAITKDLKTTENTLSLWALKDTNDVVLAMASNSSRICDIYTLKLNNEIIDKSDLEILNEPGNSRISDINSFHYNIKNLTYKKLSDVSKVIIESLKDVNNLNTFTKKDVIKILKKAVLDKRLNIESLNDNVKKVVMKELDKDK